MLTVNHRVKFAPRLNSVRRGDSSAVDGGALSHLQSLAQQLLLLAASLMAFNSAVTSSSPRL